MSQSTEIQPFSALLPQMIARMAEPARGKMREDLLSALGRLDAPRVAGLLRILGDVAALSEKDTELCAREAHEFDEDRLRLNEWCALRDAIAPPSVRVLPKGLGGAQDDEELANVALFLAKYVDGGDLPPLAKQELRMQIDANMPGDWTASPDDVRSIKVEPYASRNGRLAIVRKGCTGYIYF